MPSTAVEKGEILSIIGPNGAGKSSIFNLISRIYPPTSSKIFSRTRTSRKSQPTTSPGSASPTFQNIKVFENATVLSNLPGRPAPPFHHQLWQELLFLPSVRGSERCTATASGRVIEFLDLEPYRDKLISGLPYGVRKVIELARAVLRPKLILLDEPSSGSTSRKPTTCRSGYAT